MRIFGFGDKSDYQLHVKQGTAGYWYWILVDKDGKSRSVNTIPSGLNHGFGSEEEAIADARDVVKGLGADFRDIDIERERRA